ncbi:MAG TPA: hypothetical protein VE967_14560 [Gemmatimonadaceae bacterium]|nr:hypothetical protein [Gemmatimonadaceae bacterium]
MKNRSLVLGFALAISGACAGGYVSAGNYEYHDRRPPSLRAEIRVAPPGPGYVWVAGHWGYRGNDYYWIPGAWMRVETGYRRWQPGQWRHDRRGWYWVEGHWR